jgi:hypothetical protein
VVQRTPDPQLEGRYRLLLPDCEFEWGGFQDFVKSIPKPRRHYPTF